MQNLTKLFFALTFVLFLGACNSDEDLSTLEGTWTAVSFSANVMSTTNFNGSEFTSTIDVVGSEFDYDLTFTDAAFTTSGGYTIDLDVDSGGNPQSSTDVYTNVSGSGTYTATNSEMTVNGQFFNFEYNGMPVISASGPQTADYEINSNDELIFTQNETMTSTSSGSTTTSVVFSTSKWVKQ